MSGEKVYTKSVNLTNGITVPARVVKILENFDLNGAASELGDEVLTQTETVGRLYGKDLPTRIYGEQRQI